ncbi:hypothetical protein ABPG74_010427 [Tetrahymena malaccensis]
MDIVSNQQENQLQRLNNSEELCNVQNTQLAQLQSNLQVQNQQNEEQYQTEIQNINMKMNIQQQIQIDSIINSITQKYKLFLLYDKNNNEILKYCPKPISTQNEEEGEDQQNYINNITKLKSIVHTLLNFPLKYNKIQNQFQHIKQDFERVHIQISDHISNLLKVTYNINQENLGSNFAKLEKFQKSLEECKDECEKLISELYEMDQVNSFITEHYSSFFGKELQDTQTVIESLQNQLKQYEDEIEIKKNKILIEYCQISLLISQLNTKIKIHEENVNQLQTNKNELKNKLKLLEKNTEKKMEQEEIATELYQKQLIKERDMISKEKLSLYEKNNNDQNDRLKQYQQQINALNKKYPLGNACSQVEKKYFHYYFVQDESGSFKQEHECVINGVTELFKKIKPNDYITYIKFDDSSNLNIHKIQKKDLSSDEFRSKIYKSRNGGTNFSSAFLTLQQQIQQHYNENEYPIIIFITDGQDNSNLDSIISYIHQTCQDILFYTIGYGNVNEKYLKNITNKFNNTIGEEKEINGKRINLFYLKNTPDQLISCLSTISQQQTLITIEDIQNAQQYFKCTFESISQISDEYFNKKEEFYDNKIKNLNNQIKKLFTGDIKSSEQIKDFWKDNIEKLNIQINNLTTEENEEITQIGACKEQINQAKLKFMQQINHNYTGRIENINLELELENKQKSLKNEQIENIKNLKQKIADEKQGQEKYLQEKNTEIIKLGFRNLQHFKKFNELFNNSEDSQKFYINHISDLISLINYLSQQNDLINQAIENSQIYLKESRKLDHQYHVFTQFKQIDETINPENAFESIKKIIFIMNSSIEERCKSKYELNLFYDQTIRSLNLNEIIQQVDKKREDQIEYIQNEVIPIVITDKPRELTLLQRTDKHLNESLYKNSTALKFLKEDLNAEKDQEKIKELQTEIKMQEQELKTLNKQLQETKKQLDKIQFQFETDNQDKINLVNQVVLSLIQAVLFAFYKKKQQMALAPFQQLIYGTLNFTKSLKNYKILSIESGFKSSNK